MIKSPINTVVTDSPGIPSVNIGMSEPPAKTYLVALEPAPPLIIALPNSSKCSQKRSTSLKPKKQAIDKDKDGVKYKYPARTCKECVKYPCFIGIEKKICDFAKYGCVDYKEK